VKGRHVVIGFGVVAAAGIGAMVLINEPETEPISSLGLPEPGEVRPDYLADGTPVWVIGHDDGEVSVLSGFDTHRPSGLGKLLWWCDRANGFENPEHVAKYDEYGLWIGGPALSGLPRYAARIDGTHVVVGALRAAPPHDAPHTGPAESDRQWCIKPDAKFHAFDDWQAWNSPTEAVDAAPDGWILLDGELALRDGSVVMCGTSGCSDSVVAANIDPTDAEREFGPLFGERFIAQVRDGVLTGVTRVTPSNAEP
jgi:hypothetical protein